MPIRNATTHDSQAIRELLDQLGYPRTCDQIGEKLEKLIASPSDEVFVYEQDGETLAFITLSYTVQLAFEKDFCEIGYFVVDQNARSQNIGKQLEEYACQRAKERGCFMIQVFSLLKRTDAHRFYQRQGYQQIEKYFAKEI